MIFWAAMDTAQVTWCATTNHLVRRQARQACDHRMGALLPADWLHDCMLLIMAGTMALNCC